MQTLTCPGQSRRHPGGCAPHEAPQRRMPKRHSQAAVRHPHAQLQAARVAKLLPGEWPEECEGFCTGQRIEEPGGLWVFGLKELEVLKCSHPLPMPNTNSYTSHGPSWTQNITEPPRQVCAPRLRSRVEPLCPTPRPHLHPHLLQDGIPTWIGLAQVWLHAHLRHRDHPKGVSAGVGICGDHGGEAHSEEGGLGSSGASHVDPNHRSRFFRYCASCILGLVLSHPVRFVRHIRQFGTAA